MVARVRAGRGSGGRRGGKRGRPGVLHTCSVTLMREGRWLRERMKSQRLKILENSPCSDSFKVLILAVVIWSLEKSKTSARDRQEEERERRHRRP